VARLAAIAPDRYVSVQPPPSARTRVRAQAWEQLALPARAARIRAALILSPANLAPVAWPRNVLVMHDAAVLRQPTAYSRTYRSWHRQFGLRCARRALTVITVSEFSRRELVSAGGLDPERLVVIGGGVGEHFTPGAPDPEVAARLGLNRPYVLTVATADSRKNLAALEPAAASLGSLGIDLAWAGDARPYFARAPAVRQVRTLGYVDDGDLLSLYRGAAAFVLPSRYEGFGLTCLEAMACGVPVVAADRGALPETCGDAALLVDPDRPQELARALVQAVTDGELRDRLRRAGRDRAKLYSWDRVAAETHALLLRAADGA
jgi:glycosyltransferase involved in cell wall biosynthesis